MRAGIDTLEVEVTHEVKEGKFAFVLVIPDHAPAGVYSLFADVQEKDRQGEVMNEGRAQFPLQVKQVVSRVVIALNSQSVLPGEELLYNVIAYDQTDNEVEQEATVIIRAPEGDVLEQYIKTGDTQGLILPTNSSVGKWILEAQAGEIRYQQTFSVGILQKASFSLSNGTLIVSNIGNVPYQKKLKINIGGTTEVLDLNLEVGKNKRFKLLAPDGEYAVEILEDDVLKKLGTSFLTGNAIGVKEIQDALGSILPIWAWIVIIVLFVFLVIISYRKVRKKPYWGKTPNSFKQARFIPVQNVSALAHSGSGKREEVIVLAVQVKNTRELEKHPDALTVIGQAIRQTRQAYQVFEYSEGKYNFIIFPNSKNINTALSAVRAAKILEAELSSYNRKHAVKISFSIGLHIGEMIIEMHQGKAKFTSLGNTIIAAKMATERTERGVVVSLPIRRLLAGQIKGEPLPGGQYWRVMSVSERTEHEEFINKFMGREKKS